MLEEEKKTRYLAQAINDEILEKLSLKNRYNFLNNNLMPYLKQKDMNYLKKLQRFCMRFEKKNNITHGPDENIYDWVGAFGKQGYITRNYNYDYIDLPWKNYGAASELMLSLALDMFDPQFNMATGATVLSLTPIHHHHDNIQIRQDALKELLTGQSNGCICITEPERGSDAVHMLTTCDPQEDGSFILNGDKIFNTNAPIAKWATAYATAEQNNGDTMAQFLINTSWDGWSCERVLIPGVPKIFLGKEKFENIKVPKEYVLGGIGTGRDHLFEGLVPERIGIAMMSVAECWNAISHAAIYANLRKQFEQIILLHQGVGFLLTDLWARTTNITLGLLRFCETYDEKLEKFGGELPTNIAQAMVASASQFKYGCTKLAQEVCYEAANVMGGAGLCDNTLMQDLLGISSIQEIVGGSRQIQSYIMSMALRQFYKLSV